MKITRIEARHVLAPFTTGGPQIGPRPALSNKPWVKMGGLVVRVETDDGLVGWGEGAGNLIIPGTQAILKTLLGPWFIGKDPRAFSVLMQDAFRTFASYGRSGPMIFALSAMDIALWDLAAKRSGLPLYRLLGGRAAPLACYASLMRYGGDLDAIARNTRRACDAGYRILKLHEVTVPAFRAARDAAAPGTKITLDVNCAWTLNEAKEIAREIRDDKFHWLEEPIWPPEDFSAMAELRREGVPIAAGENIATLSDFHRMLEARAVDVIQPSAIKIGGLSALLRVFSLAQAYSVQVVPHAFYWGPGHLATAAALTTLAAPPPLETAFITMDNRPHALFNPEVANLTLPETPGLGFEPDREAFEKHTESIQTID